MAGRYKPPTEERVEELEPIATPNLVVGELYWLSTHKQRGIRRDFAKHPIRARLAIQAAKRAVQWTGEAVFVWHVTNETREIVWCEWPTPGMKNTGRSLLSFIYAT